MYRGEEGQNAQRMKSSNPRDKNNGKWPVAPDLELRFPTAKKNSERSEHEINLSLTARKQKSSLRNQSFCLPATDG